MTTLREPLADASDMFAVHTMFRREFGLMSGLVRAVDARDCGRAAIVAGHVDLVSAILRIHHSGEDRYLWPLLRDRARGKTAILDTMERQHERLHAHLAGVARAVAAWRQSASADSRDALSDAIDRLVPGLGEHLAVEERDAVPLIERYLTAAEYGLTVREGAAVVPADKMPAIFGMMMYETAPEVVETVVAGLPATIQPVIKELAGAAYAEYARALYATATPPRNVTGSALLLR